MGIFHNKAFQATIVIFPLILIHGYSDDSSIWSTWEYWLEQSNITKVHSINFKDSCGSVKEHAIELGNKIRHYDGKINIIAYSKGGLDARQFIANNPDKVANLIMIGTPNKGTPAAYMDITDCYGGRGLTDLWPESAATKVPDQNSTKYYAIAGNVPSPCAIIMIMGDCQLTENDGFVPIDSALSHYESLGVYHVNHSSLLTNRDIYDRVISIIYGNKER